MRGFTVLDGGAFAGEGLTDVIRPKEKRILSYGLDLHLDIAVHRDGAPERGHESPSAREYFDGM
jgi:hypothetical protein